MSANGSNGAKTNNGANGANGSNGTKKNANSMSNVMRFNATKVNSIVTENSELSNEEKRNLALTANKRAAISAKADEEEALEAASGNALKPANAPVGGRRRTKRAKGSKRCTMKGGKISKGASKWNLFVMRTFKDMRKKNKSVKLMDAMKECSKQKKKGVKY